MDEALKNLVRERAADRCEYCQIHQDQDRFYTFGVDHPDFVLLRETLIEEGTFPP